MFVSNHLGFYMVEYEFCGEERRGGACSACLRGEIGGLVRSRGFLIVCGLGRVLTETKEGGREEAMLKRMHECELGEVYLQRGREGEGGEVGPASAWPQRDTYS